MSKLLILALLSVVICSQILTDNDEHESLFQKFIQDFNKVYESESEWLLRFRIFKNNILRMISLKQQDPTAEYSITKFADLTEEEFEQKYLKLNKQKIQTYQQLVEEGPKNFLSLEKEKLENKFLAGSVLPTEFDWREKGIISRVKEQSTCGACWTFSTTGIIESQYALKYGKLIEFSEQQLVDCDPYDDGCDGGLMTEAFKYIKKAGGIQTAEDYGKYKVRVEDCHFDESKVAAKISDYYLIQRSEDAIKKELVLNGPIAIGFNAKKLQLYNKGVFQPTNCNDDINHALLIVGYGEEDGVPYWNVKNQWGEDWGENGYFRVIMGQGVCGIDTYASIAFVE